ncbi:hypothetical protein ASPSYDRAFT_48374 [Aspergillus sydowii CBS 593.65]|uniref:Uncharacterized protein n=1 Tax=Aspergillus sydowii CBS 593.65 TaxID=1036612 RepID=A0A1L9T9H2_9EURO|nr:uncharacterized protein ASPSYDRAFT_48374 [Aspergillus sydowii CBS 593.65]OJJ56088.1 hypothetical protein ASPSYDRAFT_48374 [Aspergillus sydowii CBS 593.65]
MHNTEKVTRSDKTDQMAKTVVAFETKPLIIPDRLQRPEATSIVQRLNSDSIRQHNEPTNILDIPLLETIKCFLTFAGCLYNPSLNNTPTILFKVQYHSGATGFVNCASTIRGKPKTIQESFHMHAKVRDAKELISDGDWEYMARRFGYSKAQMMEFEWLQVMRGNALYTELPDDSGDCGDGGSFASSYTPSSSISTSSGWMGRGKWALGVGIAVGVGLGVGAALGLGVGVGFGLGVGLGLLLFKSN